MIYLHILFAFVRIGLFAFGGGYATLPLIEKIIIEGTHWLTYSEFLEVVAISELTPGPIAINAATYVGYKVGGFWGSLLATLGVCLPSIIIILIAVRILDIFKTNIWVKSALKGLRPAVIALVASAAYSIVASGRGISDLKSLAIGAAAFLAIRSHRIDPIWVLVLAGVAGAIVYI